MTRRAIAWPAGIPCWVDLATPDLDGARAAYGEAFGWEIPAGNPAFGGYTNATLDGRHAAGMMPVAAPTPVGWRVYMATDDVAATAAAITGAGGTIVVGPMDVPETGRMLLARDPQGALFGVWEAGRHNGVEIAGEAGSLAWEHLNTHDAVASMAFYGTVFGWAYNGMGDTTHTFSGQVGQPPYGSLGPVGPEPSPAEWVPFFGTEDTDAAVAVFQAHGATILLPANDTPWGRMAALRDSAGALFNVLSISAETPQVER